MEVAIEGRAAARVQQIRAAFALGKPGIAAFITMSAAAAYIVAGGRVTSATFIHVIVATALVAAGAAGLNQVREAAIDARMRRTRNRPVPSGTLARQQAVTVAVGLSVSGFAYSAMALPWLTTVLLALSHASYVLVYTPLKRVTPHNTLVGGIPGSLPVLAGWVAAGAGIDAVALALTFVLFLWQIPHFLAIGWLCRDDYRNVGFRMLTVDDPDGVATARMSAVYTLALLPVSLVPFLAGTAGRVYAAAAFAVGAWYLWCAAAFLARRTDARARALFLASLVYLPALLGVLVLERLAS
ncbi:MAG TPA: heme o synthase [Longimicrobiales bacterium]